MPLKIIIVGAGIVGLSTAISLREANHDVVILEQSSFADEIGAAINVAPNASRIFDGWGMDQSALRGVPCDHLSVWTSHMNLIKTPVVTAELSKRYGFEANWSLVHRADLHSQLKKFAFREGPGKKPKIFLSSKVISIDAHKGDVRLEDGSTHSADVIIGADGIHSCVAKYVSDEPLQPQSTGQSCFRFLVPMEKMRSKPLMSKLIENCSHSVDAFVTEDRRLVSYPCRNSELLNVVAFHPAKQTGEAGHSDWLGYARKEDLAEIYQDFGPELRELCDMAEDLKLYGLSTRRPLKNYVKGRIALVGDAAHPMLPHQGQGAAQGIEDAATLGVLLSSIEASAIPGALATYNELRYARSTVVMQMSKTHDENRSAMMPELLQYVPSATMPNNVFEYTWKWDATKAARLALSPAVEKQLLNTVITTNTNNDILVG